LNGFGASYALDMLGNVVLMLRICCTHKGISLHLDHMISSNYVVIMIMLMSIFVHMYVYMYVMSHKFIMDHDY